MCNYAEEQRLSKTLKDSVNNIDSQIFYSEKLKGANLTFWTLRPPLNQQNVTITIVNFDYHYHDS